MIRQQAASTSKRLSVQSARKILVGRTFFFLYQAYLLVLKKMIKSNLAAKALRSNLYPKK